MTDRLAPDFQSVAVVGTVTSSSSISGSSGGTITSIEQDGREDLGVADTTTRRILEDILVLMNDNNDLLRRLVGG